MCICVCVCTVYNVCIHLYMYTCTCRVHVFKMYMWMSFSVLHLPTSPLPSSLICLSFVAASRTLLVPRPLGKHTVLYRRGYISGSSGICRSIVCYIFQLFSSCVVIFLQVPISPHTSPSLLFIQCRENSCKLPVTVAIGMVLLWLPWSVLPSKAWPA